MSKAFLLSRCAHLWCKYEGQSTDLVEAAEIFVRQKTQPPPPAPLPSLLIYVSVGAEQDFFQHFCPSFSPGKAPVGAGALGWILSGVV